MFAADEPMATNWTDESLCFKDSLIVTRITKPTYNAMIDTSALLLKF